MERKRMMLGAALVAVLALGVACGGDDPGQVAAADTGGGGNASTTLTATNMAFSPPTLEVAAGGSIELEL